MALIACPECAKEISSAALACPSCAFPSPGAAVAAAAKPTDSSPKPMRPPEDKASGTAPKVIIIGIAGLIGFFVLNMFANMSSTPDEKSLKRRSIELCWQEQKRESLSSGEKQMIAASCERMEGDFMQIYGTRP